MISFTKNEIEFLNSMEACRIATAHENIPHVKPVSYLFYNNTVYVATDYDTRMYKNLLKNPRVAISIDIYKDKGHKAVLLQGSTSIIENGREFSTIYQKFYEKFEWVRNDPWMENEAPFIQIIPNTKSSWGLG